MKIATAAVVLAMFAPQTPGPVPSASLVRVFVETGEATGAEFTELLTSVKELSAALAARNKTLVAVESGTAADVVIAVIDRAIEVPKVAFGVNVRPGLSTGTGPAIRRAVLKVRLSSGGTNLALKNKNIANDNPRGWKSAAEDLAEQIEKWIKSHREEILKRR